MISRFSSFFFSCLLSSLYAQNINYAKHDIHTQTIQKNQIELSLEYALLNDTIDILKLKQSEFGNSTLADSVGDLKAYGIKLRYGILEDLMLNATLSKQNILYYDEELSNTKIDIFLRYNIFHESLAYFNSGISFDIGYTSNKLDDFYLSDIDSINLLIQRFVPNQLASLIYSDGTTLLPNNPFPLPEGYYAQFNNIISPLSETPTVSMIETADTSFYTRFLFGFYNKYNIMDFYLGFKKTTIENTLTANQEILALAQAAGFDITRVLDRDESMWFFGFNYSLNAGKFIYELNYEYERFLRESGLDYVNYNHVLQATLSYMITNDLLINVGAKIFYRQLNGEIPYLYNSYTQTTFDHKYGFTTFGVQYKF